MSGICRALAFLFAFLVLAHGPIYNVTPGPAGHPMNPAHTRTTP
jgi:hypothetical protein